MNLLIGMMYGLIAQVLTFLQLQGNIKYNLMQNYPITTMLMSMPISLCYIKSVEYIVKHYDGQIWPSRIIGFGVGIVVFTLMSVLLFKEPLNLKTIICLVLSIAIILIQTIK